MQHLNGSISDDNFSLSSENYGFMEPYSNHTSFASFAAHNDEHRSSTMTKTENFLLPFSSLSYEERELVRHDYKSSDNCENACEESIKTTSSSDLVHAKSELLLSAYVTRSSHNIEDDGAVPLCEESVTTKNPGQQKLRVDPEEEKEQPVVKATKSKMAGLVTSSVSNYRDVYFTEKCSDDVHCLRHADIPGLFDRMILDNKQCSTLKAEQIELTDAPRVTAVVDYHEHGRSHWSINSNHSRGASGAMVKKGKMKNITVKVSENVSSILSTRFSYECSEDLIQSITPLLHAHDFSKIVSIVDSHLGGVLGGKEQIPLLFVCALSHFKLGHHNNAKTRFIQCDEICFSVGRSEDSALCNLYLGDIQFLSRNYQEASTHYENAIIRYSSDTVATLFRMVPPSLSAIHAKRGSALRNASKMVDAIQEYKLAIKEAKTEKDKLAANTSLGNLYQSLGENSSALAHYEQSVEICQNLHDYVSLGWAHGNMGNAYLGLFQKDKALCHLQKSLDLTVEHEPTPQAIGRAYNNLGTAYQSLGDLDKANEMYQLAQDQAIYGNDTAGQARVCGNMGNVHMLRKNYEEAILCYTNVLSLSKDRSTLSTARHNRGCAYYELGESKLDQEYGDQMKLKSIPDDTISIIDGIRSSTAIETKFYIHGPGFEDMADCCPRKVSSTATKYFTSGCEDLEEVVKFHETHLDNIKGSSKGLTLSVSLFETNSRTFHRLQDCLINLGKYPKAFLVAEQSRARTLGELMLKRKEWYLDNPPSSPMSFEQILTNLGTTENPVLYMSYTGARLIGWVFITKQDKVILNAFDIPLKDDQFDGKSFDYHLRYNLTDALVERSFEMYREVGDYNDDTSAPVQTLYNLIAKPLLTILKAHKTEKAKEIVVITDSYTALLPFSSLHNSKEDTFLGDSYCFQLMPSFLTMSILNQLSDINVVHLPTDSQNMCIVGNPKIPQFKYNDEVWNLGKLPHAKKEAESVAYIMKTTPIVEGQATKRAVVLRLMNAKIIHLATHGNASAGFLAFGMLVSIGQDVVADDEGVLLYPKEVEKLNINPALVVLSSCDSGRGAVKADGIQGMARAFILAGAQAVLTTLWRVPDESAAIFMQFFYQYMMDGLKSTNALQKAILSIRCFSKYSQYIHWSGYQLTGRDIHLHYTIPEEIYSIEKLLGTNNAFPQLQEVKQLESFLVNTTCFPTDIQILQGTPGLSAREIIIDFIYNNYMHFSGGIYWINCDQLEFVNAGVKSIEKAIGGTLEAMQLSELQQCLIVLDGMTELPQFESLQKFLSNKHTHSIILYHSYHPPDDLIRSIDHKLLRGCRVHHLEPLSMILSTQRIVYSIQKVTQLCPRRNDQAIIEKVANSTFGSPILVNITAQLFSSCLRNTSGNPHEILENLATFMGIINVSPSTSESSIPKQDSSSSGGDSSSSEPIMSPNGENEGCTPRLYDSWDSIAGLLTACQFDSETILLLNCMSQFGCPLPITFVSALSSLITKTSGRSHLTGSLLNQLMDKGFVEVYPPSLIFHKNIKSESCSKFVYVPKCIGNYILKNLGLLDKAVALTTCYHTLSHAVLPCCSETEGLFKSFLVQFELNSDIMGDTCYGELFRLYLSYVKT